jgi:hypothetical protein
MTGDSETALKKVEDVSSATSLLSPGSDVTRTSAAESRTEPSHVDDRNIVDGLCQKCRQILDNWNETMQELSEGDDFGCELRHYSVLELRRSAEKGMHVMCTFYQ